MAERKSYRDMFEVWKDAEGMTELLLKWETLSANLGQYPPNAPILLPDLFVISPGASMTSRLIRDLSSYLQEKGNLMDFYGDVPCFEFLLNYCDRGEEFTELLRFMDEVKANAGFRNAFHGVIHIQMDAWLGHHESRHFLDFMDYLAENTSDWLIVLSVSSGKTEKIRAMEAMLSMFLRIEKITLHMPPTETYVAELERGIRKYGFRLDEGARELLRESIDVLKKNRYFDSSYSIKLLCSDIVYEAYSHEIRTSKVLTAEDLAHFSAGGEYIQRTLRKLRESRTIGFAVPGREEDI